MASAKRKQDEKHLKILRELVSQTSNKECFDCRQRGPTYVNMTIGSFVCTSCSGMLRGLTPPHRVKSISMATFTQEEIEFVKERGNEHCKRIWLAPTDSGLPPNLDIRDDQKMKDLMSAKYEHKRWYSDPTSANQNSNKKNETTNGGRSSQPSIPRVPQAETFAAAAPPTSRRNKNSSEPVDSFTPDFVADFSKFPDPFRAATRRFAQPAIIPQPSFANFDNNPAFDSSNADGDTSISFDRSFGSRDSSNRNNVANAPPSEDRYAALKDLDSLMKRTQLKEEEIATAASVSPWSANNSNVNATNSLGASSNDQTTRVIANPFTGASGGGDLWPSSPNLLNNNMQSIESPLRNSINPFRTTTDFSPNNECEWAGIGTAGVADVIPSGQPTTQLSGKVWQPSVSTYRANPFTVGSGVVNMARNSNNPFL